MADNLPMIKSGQRVIVSGRTGTGKSTHACWLLNRSLQHWVILNPKHTEAYAGLPDSHILHKFKEADFERSIKKYRFTIINFSGGEATPEFMDEVIEYIHNNFKNIGICVDELYTIHGGAGRAGPGLIALLTRGRESKQSFLGLTQRPAWISKFCYSEADYVGSMDILLSDDRKTIRDNTGCDHFMERLKPHQWLWFDVVAGEAKKYGPVPKIKLDKQ